jgi:hypothetical protein
MAVLGVINGFSRLPAEMQDGVKKQGDSIFIHTTYSFNTAVESTFNYAEKLITDNGGEVSDKKIKIKKQVPVAPPLEVSFPDLVFGSTISIFDEKPWKLKGKWKILERKVSNNLSPEAKYSGAAGDELELTFTGTGASLNGRWVKDGGKADIFVDGVLHRSIDTYYWFANQQHNESIWHVVNLKPGEHKIRVAVKGEKRPESEGTNVYITGATIFKTEKKKSEGYKFSFE